MRSLALALFCLLLISPAFAQSSRGTITAQTAIRGLLQGQRTPSRNRCFFRKSWHRFANGVMQQIMNQEGISAVSAPVKNLRGELIGALGVVVPSFRMNREKARTYGKKCAEMTAQLSSILS